MLSGRFGDQAKPADSSLFTRCQSSIASSPPQRRGAILLLFLCFEVAFAIAVESEREKKNVSCDFDISACERKKMIEFCFLRLLFERNNGFCNFRKK